MTSGEERGFRVRGRVQGVGFRWWTRRVACTLRIVGTVRNRSDGTVEIRARGSAGALASLARELRKGPAGARVEEIEDFEIEEPLLREGFDIIL